MFESLVCVVVVVDVDVVVLDVAVVVVAVIERVQTLSPAIETTRHKQVSEAQ
jgi:hypothetical protein